MEIQSSSTGLQHSAVASAMESAAWTPYLASDVVRLTGSDRLDFLHRMTTNDFSRLEAGYGKQTVVQTEKARIIDVVTVLQDQNQALLLTSAGNAGTVVNWLRKYIIMEDVKVTDVTSAWSRIDVLGPHSAGVVKELTGVDVSTFAICQWKSSADDTPMFIVRLPSYADLGYAIFSDRDTITSLTNILSDHAEALPSLSAHETEYLRICSGVGIYGKELTDAYNPLEAGLLHITSFTKGCYIGQEVVARLDSYNKVKQRIMGLTSATLKEGWQVVDGDTVIGTVTSVVPALHNETCLALAYVRQTHATDGTTVSLRDENGNVHSASLHLLPFEH